MRRINSMRVFVVDSLGREPAVVPAFQRIVPPCSGPLPDYPAGALRHAAVRVPGGFSRRRSCPPRSRRGGYHGRHRGARGADSSDDGGGDGDGDDLVPGQAAESQRPDRVHGVHLVRAFVFQEAA